MLIDAHCHFFTKSLMAETVVSQSTRLQALNSESLKKRMATNEDIRRVVNLMEIAFSNTPEQHYQTMKSSYGQDFIAVPLMLDLAYALDTSLDTDSTPTQRFLHRIQSSIERTANEKSKKFTDWAEQTLTFMSQSLRRNNPMSKINIFEHSYQEQLDELVDIKQKYSKNIFPFFSIDPRRNDQFQDGILGEIKQYVGKDKPFIGLKLYPSLGYSPTNPLLYSDDKRETVYSWCEANAIPITVHCAPTGFSHFVELVKIEGDIYHPASGTPMPANSLYTDGIIKFSKNIPFHPSSTVIEERLSMLTHPILWRKVLTRYPKLRLNLAHCGGTEQVIDYSNGLPIGFWSSQILELVNEFKNVYTDLSCLDTPQSSADPLVAFYNNVYKSLPKRSQKKIMYGSDYFMLSLFEDNLNRYLNKFKIAFGDDFTKISEKNSALFLGLENESFFYKIFS